jgi:hypothetical protein
MLTYIITGGPHKSTNDPDDPKEVVSVRLKDENQKRIGTIHIHEDGISQYRSKGSKKLCVLDTLLDRI